MYVPIYANSKLTELPHVYRKYGGSKSYRWTRAGTRRGSGTRRRSSRACRSRWRSTCRTCYCGRWRAACGSASGCWADSSAATRAPAAPCATPSSRSPSTSLPTLPSSSTDFPRTSTRPLPVPPPTELFFFFFSFSVLGGCRGWDRAWLC